MADVNIQIKQRNSSGAWDALYPKSKGSLITTTDGKTVEEHVVDNGKHIQTVGNITESTSSVLTITGGTGSTLGGGVSIQVKKATASQSGYLSNTDFATFNGKQNALGYTPIDKSGDTMAGALTLNGAPSLPLHASTKKYVDDSITGLGAKQNAIVVSATEPTTPSVGDIYYAII